MTQTKKGPAEVGRFRFTGTSLRSVREILRDQAKAPREEESGDDRRTAAQRFILQHVDGNGDHDGEVLAADVIAAGEKVGFTKTELTKARFRCKSPKVETRKVGLKGGWVWFVATDDNQPTTLPAVPWGAIYEWDRRYWQ